MIKYLNCALLHLLLLLICRQMLQQPSHPVPISPQEDSSYKHLTQNQDQIQLYYSTWRKNAPYLYNTIYTQCSTWPSLTAQWLPDYQIYKQEGYSINRVIYATNTSGQEQDYLIVAKVKLPYFDQNKKPDSDQEEDDPANSIGLMADKKEDKIQIYSMIQHDGQINRARYNPFKTNIIATKSTNGGVYVFNYIQHSKDGKSLNNSTKIHLVGHEDEGFGLTWSESNQGILASAANDSKVLTWDLNKVAEKSKEGVPYTHSFEGHKSPVNDIACHKIWPNVMASCDDQGNILFWDFREHSKFGRNSGNHEGEIYTLDFSKTHEYMYVSGGQDQLIHIWDLRKHDPYLKLEGHVKAITKIQISQKDKNIVWSSSSDRTVRMWDLANPPTPTCPQEQQLKQQSPFNKHCRFIHAGHRDAVSDFSIHPQDDNLLFSVDEGNELHIFDPAY